MQKIQNERGDVAETGNKGEQGQSALTGIYQRIMGGYRKYHKKYGKNKRYLKFQRVTAVLVFIGRSRYGGTLPLGMQEPGCSGGNSGHNQQIGIDNRQGSYAEYADQYQEPQEHHTDRQQHGGHIFGRFLR